MTKTRDYWLATNDKNGKTIVVVPMNRASDMFEAKKIANKYFREKLNNLHCYAGAKKGNKIESRTELTQEVNVWMVWRYK